MKKIEGDDRILHEASILYYMREMIGSGQVTSSEIHFAPLWTIEKSTNAEYDQTWTDAYEEVMESDLPKDANVISSYVVFKIKTTPEG